MAIVGLLPAAGYATRLQPLDCSKEVLPVGGRPVIDYTVERMRLAGATELVVVTREEKDDVAAYARGVGATVVLARPETVTASFAAGVRRLADDDVALLGWPDAIWEPRDGYRPLVAAVEAGRDAALGLFRLESGLERSDVVVFGDAGELAGIRVKPARPPSEWVWGIAAARALHLRELEREEWPGAYFDLLLREGRDVVGIPLSDAWLDIGTHESLAAAEAWLASRRVRGRSA